jgi:hypothetical protein
MPLVRDLERIAIKAPSQVVGPAIRTLRGKERNSLVNQALVRLLRQVRPKLPPQEPKKAWGYREDVVLTRPTSSTDVHLDEAIALLGRPSRQPVEDEIIDRIFALAEKCSDNQVKGAIALVLGETRKPYAKKPLVKLLLHVEKRGDPHVSWCAADGLIALHLDSAQQMDLVDELIAALDLPWIRDNTRHRILYTIARRGVLPEFDQAVELAKAGILTWGGRWRLRSIDLAYLWLPTDDPERQRWVDELVPILTRILGPTGNKTQPFRPKTNDEWILKRVVTALGRIGPARLRPMLEALAADLDTVDHWPACKSKREELTRSDLRRATARAIDDLARRFPA